MQRQVDRYQRNSRTYRMDEMNPAGMPESTPTPMPPQPETMPQMPPAPAEGTPQQ